MRNLTIDISDEDEDKEARGGNQQQPLNSETHALSRPIHEEYFSES